MNRNVIYFNLWTGADGQAMADVEQFGYLLDRHVDPDAPEGQRAKPFTVETLQGELAERGLRLGEGYAPEKGVSAVYTWKHPVVDREGNGIGCLRLDSDQHPSVLGMSMMARR